MELDDPEATSGTVLQMLEDGYMIHDRLLRPARVVVAKRRRAQPPLTS
jgi:molecular chaperone GrpE